MNEFMQRYQELGEEFDSSKIKLRSSFRVNTLKITDEELLKRLNLQAEKISFLDNAYFYESDFSISSTPEYLMGYVYSQEAASQLPPQILKPKEEEKVLDMCASPGSKTTQMASMMNNKGVIVSLESNNLRIPKLQNNLERCGVTNCIVIKKDARFADDLKMEFDKVLLDAPCSGNFSIDKEWFNKRKLSDLKAISKTQKKLLDCAYHVLKKEGVLVYSTCSLEPEENELNIEWILKRYSDLKLEEIKLEIGDQGLTNIFGEEINPEIKKCLRIWPHKTGLQGFFVAKLKKQ
jgi:NOL1/NOP2/sun family putative RNA methylase